MPDALLDRVVRPLDASQTQTAALHTQYASTVIALQRDLEELARIERTRLQVGQRIRNH